MINELLRWSDMCFDDLYSEYLDCFDSDLGNYLIHYYYYEFNQSERDRKIEDEGLRICEEERQYD